MVSPAVASISENLEYQVQLFNVGLIDLHAPSQKAFCFAVVLFHEKTQVICDQYPLCNALIPKLIISLFSNSLLLLLFYRGL